MKSPDCYWLKLGKSVPLNHLRVHLNWSTVLPPPPPIEHKIYIWWFCGFKPTGIRSIPPPILFTVQIAFIVTSRLHAISQTLCSMRGCTLVRHLFSENYQKKLTLATVPCHQKVTSGSVCRSHHFIPKNVKTDLGLLYW